MFPFEQYQTNLNQRRQLQKHRLRHHLQLQSRQIERVMEANHLPARVSGGRIAPQAVQFDLHTQANNSWEWFRSLTGDLRQALGVPQIQISRENGRLQVAVARQADVPVRLLDVMAMGKSISPETAIIGLSDQGLPVSLPLRKNHILIAGNEGAGKTSLLRSIAVSLALINRQSRLQQIIIAPIFSNNRAFSDLEPLTILPHLTAQIAYRVEEAAYNLNWLVGEMESRLLSGECSPAIVLMVDEAVQLMEAGGESVIEAVTMLLQRGDKAGIRLIMTTSKPDSELLDSHIKANLTLRIIGRVENAFQAKAATGLDNSEAEYLLGHGDFLLIDNSSPTYFQAAFIGDYDLHLSLKKLQKNFKYSILARRYSIRPELPNLDSGPIPASFWMRNGTAYFSDEEE